MITIMLVDDHDIVRRGLAMVLTLEEDFEIVASAQDGASAIALYEQFQPKITLLDLNMEPVDGITVLKTIRSLDPTAKVIVLSSFFDANHVLPAIEAGAKGYLVKTSDASQIIDTIRKVDQGKTAYDQDAMNAMAKGLQDRALLQELTERETDVLKLLAKGYSNQEIADTLYIGIKTVKTHVSNILAKLHVEDRTQAALYAVAHGYIE